MTEDPPTPEDLEIAAAYEADLEAKQNGTGVRRKFVGLTDADRADYAAMEKLWPGKSITFVWDKVEQVRRAELAKANRKMRWLTVNEITQPLPPIEWICEPLRIAPGAVTMFAGYGYSGKTAAAQSLVMSMVHRKDVFGVWRTVQGLAAHADYEQGRRLTVERYQRLGRGMGIDDGWSDLGQDALRVVPLPEIYLDDKAAFDEYCWLCDGGVRLLLVDSFRAGVPSIDENDSKARIFLDMLARVSEKMGTAALVIHHFNKDSERGGVQRLRGTGAIFDACQTVWSFVANDGDPIIAVNVLKDRLTGLKDEGFGIRFQDIGNDALRIVHCETRQLKSKAEITMGRTYKDVLDFVRKNPDCSLRDIEGAVTGKAATIRLVVKREINKTFVNLGSEHEWKLRVK